MIQFLLEYFTWTFTYLTSVLCLWGFVISAHLLRMVIYAKSLNRSHRSIDVLSTIAFFLISVFLLLVLFVFPEYSSNQIHIIFFIEIWYLFFITYFTTTYIRKR